MKNCKFCIWLKILCTDAYNSEYWVAPLENKLQKSRLMIQKLKVVFNVVDVHRLCTSLLTLALSRTSRKQPLARQGLEQSSIL